ncbi:hypothetical protein CDAR_565291 [Caerostris darwini]|uniref:Uncharacterized protein n=1 Tax=Caerostris darwini TaxID=1538125 RepID=A0AAV4TUC0_9ARAC|nr:hypothetical protein CDAR_565291 [Caerostris darwini]
MCTKLRLRYSLFAETSLQNQHVADNLQVLSRADRGCNNSSLSTRHAVALATFQTIFNFTQNALCAGVVIYGKFRFLYAADK